MNVSVGQQASRLSVRATSALTLTQLREWLSCTPDRSGSAPLAARLVSPVDDVVAGFARAYSAGPFGFDLNVDALRYPADRLRGLRERIERGEVDDFVIVEFPRANDLATLGLSASLSVSEFMAMQLVARHHSIAIHDLRELDIYRFADAEVVRHMRSPRGYSNSIHRASHGLTRPQPRVAEVLGETTIVFTTSVRTPARSRGTFADASQRGIRLLSLAEYFAAMLVVDTRNSTHPALNRPEWVGAITRNLAAYITVSGAGLRVRCTTPDNLQACSRYRAAF